MPAFNKTLSALYFSSLLNIQGVLRVECFLYLESSSMSKLRMKSLKISHLQIFIVPKIKFKFIVISINIKLKILTLSVSDQNI